MLKKITELPLDKRVAGVHCVPITDQGAIAMVWDREERQLTTIGGRLEENETIELALAREVFEEAGMKLKGEKVPFASWYWETTDTYTIWYIAKVESIVKKENFYEKTGYVLLNIETAKHIIAKVEKNPEWRLKLLTLAEECLKNAEWLH